MDPEVIEQAEKSAFVYQLSRWHMEKQAFQTRLRQGNGLLNLQHMLGQQHLPLSETSVGNGTTLNVDCFESHNCGQYDNPSVNSITQYTNFENLFKISDSSQQGNKHLINPE